MRIIFIGAMALNKAEILNYVEELHIWHELTEHQAVFSMEEAINVELPYPDCDAKNLFLRDDKKRNYFIVTVCGPKKVDLKAFQHQHGTRRLSFASAEDLWHFLQVKPGSVSPLGLLNNEECNVKLFLDEDFLSREGIIGIHPNDNTATIWLKAKDLLHIIQEHGNETEIVKL